MCQHFLFLSFSLLPFLVVTYGQQAVWNIQNHDPYSHQISLSPRGEYQLEWTVDFPQQRINFTVTVATRGYVALGLARNGKMDGADIVMGGVYPNGTAYFSDRHAIGNQQPLPDQRQDWILHSAQESDTHTTLSFSRVLDTCDNQDVPINDDSLYILWSYGKRDSLTEYHNRNRGAYIAYLLDPDWTPPSIHATGVLDTETASSQNILRWTIREKFLIPQRRTHYQCTVHKFSPSSPGKHHMIGFNFRVNPAAQERVHHLILYRCQVPLNISPRLIFEKFVGTAGQECYHPLRVMGLIPVPLCREFIVGHAIGATSTFLPPHLGGSLGESGADEYFLVQVHYDNAPLIPNLRSDFSLDVYYTRQLRSTEVALINVGHRIPGSPSILVPPGETNHGIFGHCSSECTRTMLPPQGIRASSAVLHTHLAGVAVIIHHFRNGQELPWILADNNYKFNYQPARLLREEVTILPGDQITVECRYDTRNANITVVGGYGTDQEMCSAFLLYHNKLEGYSICHSDLRGGQYTRKYLAGTQNYTWDQTRLENMAIWPLNLVGRTLSSISDGVNWDQELRRELRRDHLIQGQLAVCPQVGDILETVVTTALRGIQLGPPDPVSYPVEVRSYRPPNRCTLPG